MKVKFQILTLVIVCGGAIGIAGVHRTWQASSEKTEMAQLEGLCMFSVKVSDLVHEVQRERGMSAGFLGSSGKRFSKELVQQHDATNAKIADLNAFLQTFTLDSLGPIASRYLDAKSKLDTALAIRPRIRNQTIPIADAIAAYTATNTAMLDTVGYIPVMTSDTEIATKVTSYVHFVKAKERAGIERAVLANTFAKDQFGDGMFRKLVSLIAEQNTYRTEFDSLASQAVLQRYAESRKLPCVSTVKEYRDIAISKAQEGGFEKDSTDWFTAKTKEINSLKEVENFIAESLVTVAASRKQLATQQAYWALGLSVFGIALVIGFGAFAYRSILGSITRMGKAFDDLAEGDGDLTRRIEVTRDEFGALAASFNTFAQRIHDIVLGMAKNAATLSHSSSELRGTASHLREGAKQNKNQIDVR